MIRCTSPISAASSALRVSIVRPSLTGKNLVACVEIVRMGATLKWKVAERHSITVRWFAVRGSFATAVALS